MNRFDQQRLTFESGSSVYLARVARPLSSTRIETLLVLQNRVNLFQRLYYVGSQVVLPAQGLTKLLQELHIGYPGICRMKGLAQMVIWWPNIDS